jgi:non-ribosomal peptide synthetase component F
MLPPQAVIVQPDLVQKLPDAAALDSLSIHTLLLHPEVPYTAASQRPAHAARAAAGGFAPLIPATLSVAGFGAAAAASPAWTRGQLGTPDTTCYIIYTSGSTGKPKGVVVIHQGLTAYVAWFKTFFGITSADVFMQKTPTNFDASIDELWTSLSAGCRLVVAAPEAHRDVHSVMMLIARYASHMRKALACLLAQGEAVACGPEH